LLVKLHFSILYYDTLLKPKHYLFWYIVDDSISISLMTVPTVHFSLFLVQYILSTVFIIPMTEVVYKLFDDLIDDIVQSRYSAIHYVLMICSEIVRYIEQTCGIVVAAFAAQQSYSDSWYSIWRYFLSIIYCVCY